MQDKIYIYTDGSCLGNGIGDSIGGWAVVMKFRNKKRELSGGEKFSTNNRMELTGVIMALESITETKYEIEIYSDSKYVIDSISKGWIFNWIKKANFGGKKNEDLWRRFLNSYKKFADAGTNINFNWVKGHNGHPENERCDELATMESAKIKTNGLR